MESRFKIKRASQEWIVILVGIISLAAVSPRCLAANNKDVTVTVAPTRIATPISDPYMGWGIWVGRRQFGYTEQSFTVSEDTTGFGDNAPLFNWVLVDWDWASLEPEEGKFDWSQFDQVIDYWKARHKQFVVRFWVTDDSGWSGHRGAPVIPNWLWAKGLRYDTYKGNSGVLTREPSYADPTYRSIYLPALKKFLEAFAARYDKPGTPVILLQVMGYGHWADWATWYSHYKFPSLQVKHEVLADIMKVYIDTFHHIKLFEMAAADWDKADFQTMQDQMYTKALDVAVAHHFALIWTGFIDGLGGWDRDIMEKYWKEDPIIAEGNWNYNDMMNQKVHGTFEENLEVALSWHANFIHFYFDAPSYKRVMREQPDVVKEGLEPGGLGYRLVPTRLSWPGEIPAGNLLVVRQSWENLNVGRLYVQHPLKLYLTDAEGKTKYSEIDTSFDERSWVRGKTYSLISVFHLPKDLAAGTYDVRIALVNAEGNPRIQMGIEGEDGEKRYTVGTIRILPPANVAGCVADYCP